MEPYACREARQISRNMYCLFEPYLRGNKAQAFACLSKVFNVRGVASILLNDIEPSQRQAFMDSIYFQALARIRDPVMGSVGVILRLQRHLQDLKTECKELQEEYHHILKHNEDKTHL